MLRRLCVHRTRILVRDVGRVAFNPPRPPAAPATSTATTTASAFAALAALATLAALAVLRAGPAIPPTSTPPTTATTATLATLASLLAGSRRGGRWARLARRGFGRHQIAAWPEVGIDFHHANLGDLGNPARTGAAGATARTAAEARAAHRNAAGCRRRAIGWRRGRRCRHRNVVFVFYIGHWGRQDGARSLLLLRHRLFFFLRSRLVVRTHTDGLLDQPERATEREPGLRGRRFRLLGRGRLSGSWWRFFTVASAASPTPAASPSPAAGFLGLFAHRGERRRRRRALDLRAEGDFVLPVVESGQRDKSTTGGFDHELAEPREPGILLVEVRVDLLHHLLQAVRAHDVVVRRHLFDRLDDQLPRVALHVLDVARLGEAGQLVVRVVLIAILDEEIAGRLADTHADHVLAVLFELQHERREI